MQKLLLSFLLLQGLPFYLFSQVPDTAISAVAREKPQPVYKIKPWIDIPATLIGDGLSLNGMRIIYGRDPIPESEILSLDKNNINRFDRPIANNYSEKAKSASDLFFYGSMPLPLLLLIDPAIRKDGLKVGLLYLQAMGATGTIYTTSAMLANRYRPYTYNTALPMSTRQRGGARNSFFAGHPAVVATSTFFMAKVYSDHHPNMRHKWILFGLAGTITATTGYLRLKAGQHFTTDVITGMLLGTASGILIPHIHKNKNLQRLALMPNYQNRQSGFAASFKLNKD